MTFRCIQIDYQSCEDGRTVPQAHFDDCDARLDALDARLQALNIEASSAWPKAGSGYCDAVRDLRAKLDSLRWLFRVARHLSGSARERVIANITNSVSQLERAIAICEQGTSVLPRIELPDLTV